MNIVTIIVLIIGFVLTFVYVFLSTSKNHKNSESNSMHEDIIEDSNRNRHISRTVIISFCMVGATIAIGIVTNVLFSHFSQQIAETDIHTSSFTVESTNPTLANKDFETVSDKYSSDNTKDGNKELSVSEKNGKYGFVDENGNVVIDYIFDFADNFSEGLAAVRQEDSWGFIDTQGNTVIPFNYDGAWDFVDGLAPVFKDGLWGFIDKNEKTIIPYQYQNISKKGNTYYDENDNIIEY